MQKGASTLEEAFNKADVFLGLSKGGIVNESMIKKMAKNPIVLHWLTQSLKLNMI